MCVCSKQSGTYKSVEELLQCFYKKRMETSYKDTAMQSQTNNLLDLPVVPALGRWVPVLCCDHRAATVGQQLTPAGVVLLVPSVL